MAAPGQAANPCLAHSGAVVDAATALSAAAAGAGAMTTAAPHTHPAPNTVSTAGSALPVPADSSAEACYLYKVCDRNIHPWSLGAGSGVACCCYIFGNYPTDIAVAGVAGLWEGRWGAGMAGLLKMIAKRAAC